MLSNERLRYWDRLLNQERGGKLSNSEFGAMARELLSRRAQDEMVGKVVEWAAEQECDYQHIQRRRCQYKPPCGPCLARTLQAEKTQPECSICRRRHGTEIIHPCE